MRAGYDITFTWTLQVVLAFPLLTVPMDPAVLKLRSLDRAELKLVSEASMLRGVPLGDLN